MLSRIYAKLETTCTPNYSIFKTKGAPNRSSLSVPNCSSLLKDGPPSTMTKGDERVHYCSDMWLHGGLTFHCSQLPSRWGPWVQPVHSLPYHTHTQGSPCTFHKELCIPTSMYCTYIVTEATQTTGLRMYRTVQGAQLNCKPILDTERELTMNTTTAHPLQ